MGDKKKSNFATPTKEEKEKSWCQRWSNTEIVLALLLLGVVAYFIYIQFQVKIPKEFVPCGAPTYMESAVEINDFIDPSIDPCEDFHQFTCGTFFKNAYKEQLSARIVQERQYMENELEGYIVQPISSDDTPAIKLQKQFFQACLNLEGNDAHQNQIFLDLIEEIGGWPVLKGNSWNENEFDWIGVLAKCKQLGLPFNWFLQFGIYSDEKNYIKISRPTITDDWNGYYQNVMSNVIVNMSGSKAETILAVKKIVAFEKHLNKAVRSSDELTITEIQKLETIYPKVNWLDFLNNITNGSYEFTEEDEIAVEIKNYILALDNLLMHTDKRTQANYIIWKIVEQFVPFLSTPIRAVYDFYMDQQSKPRTRLNFCKQDTKTRFRYVSEVEYIRKYVKSDTRDSARELVRLVKKEFLERVERLEWFNESIGQDYLNQFKNAAIEIGGQEQIFHEEMVDDYYLHIRDLTFSEPINIIEMILERENTYHRSVFASIGQNVTDPHQTLYPMIFSVFYILEDDNRLVVPPTLLHGFFYEPSRPQYLNFASLGSLVATRLIIDLRFLTSDADGIDFAFDASNKCFEEDIANLMTDGEIKLNNTTQSVDAIASAIIGTDIAYQALQKWTKTLDQDLELFNLPYTPNQLFWIKSSLINCQQKLIDSDDTTSLDETISKYRNILTARHSRHFAQDFGCPVGGAMNPEKKC